MNGSRLKVIQIQLEALDELYKVYQEEFKLVGNQLRDLFIDIKPQAISPQRLGETHLFQQPQNTTNMKTGKSKFSKKTKSKSKERSKHHKSNHSKDKKKNKHKNKKQLSSTSSSQSSSSLQSLSSSTFSSISSSVSAKKYRKRMKTVQKLKIIMPKTSEYEIDAKPMNNNQISSIVEYTFNGHRRLSCNKNLLERVDKITSDENNKQKEQKEQQEDSEFEDLRCELKNDLEIGNNMRYYQMNPFEQCYRCKSSGHHEKQCILPIAQLCNYCLGDHTGDKCNNFCCFKCNQIGHRKQDCKFKQLLPYCIYCSRTTHLSEKCGVIRSTLTQSDTICLNCRQLGHINCINTTANY